MSVEKKDGSHSPVLPNGSYSNAKNFESQFTTPNGTKFEHPSPLHLNNPPTPPHPNKPNRILLTKIQSSIPLHCFLLLLLLSISLYQLFHYSPNIMERNNRFLQNKDPFIDVKKMR